jgi:hypothetical protein
MVAQLLLLAVIVPGVPAGECATGQQQHEFGCQTSSHVAHRLTMLCIARPVMSVHGNIQLACLLLCAAAVVREPNPLVIYAQVKECNPGASAGSAAAAGAGGNRALLAQLNTAAGLPPAEAILGRIKQAITTPPAAAAAAAAMAQSSSSSTSRMGAASMPASTEVLATGAALASTLSFNAFTSLDCWVVLGQDSEQRTLATVAALQAAGEAAAGRSKACLP